MEPDTGPSTWKQQSTLIWLQLFDLEKSIVKVFAYNWLKTIFTEPTCRVVLIYSCVFPSKAKEKKKKELTEFQSVVVIPYLSFSRIIFDVLVLLFSPVTPVGKPGSIAAKKESFPFSLHFYFFRYKIVTFEFHIYYCLFLLSFSLSWVKNIWPNGLLWFKKKKRTTSESLWHHLSLRASFLSLPATNRWNQVET